MTTSAQRLHRVVLLCSLLGSSAMSLSAQATPDVDDPPAQAATPNATPKDNADEAWTMLTGALDDPKHLQYREQALAALGLMGENSRAQKLIIDTMSNPDLDMRTAAVLAAGETKSRNVAGPLRNLLDDKEPQVAYAAATTLWKMKDRSGEDVLLAIAGGERSANPTLMNGTMHTVNKDLHNPSTIAKIGALQGASMLLGPFGVGITAYEYIRKNGGNSARAQAIDDLSEEHTDPIRKQFLACLGDKDVAVRVAAAKGLREYHDAEVSKALVEAFGDPKLPVRLTAAAAYLTVSAPAPAAATTHPTAAKKIRSSAK
jgi:HEAT repeat protein